jgi:hypothetical protein
MVVRALGKSQEGSEVRSGSVVSRKVFLWELTQGLTKKAEQKPEDGREDF